MKIRHLDIEIPADNPFANCKLGRQKYADILSNLISFYSDGFVLAINNEWGTGKTTFLKMWRQYLNKQDFKTLYFNAWENDFDSNPLVALMSELKSLTSKPNDDGFKSLLKKGAILTKSVLPSLVKAIAEKYIKTQVITEAIKNTTEAATEILKDEIDEYAKKKKGLIDFRKEVEKFISANNDGKPVIFIIDELDRCKPNYAVEVLEYLKHFFSVPGIVFVLSIDKVQLSNAIRGFYGSEQIDAQEYLRRFIDIEYTLPTPSTGDFCNYLYEYFDFDQFFYSEARSKFPEIAKDKDSFISFSTILFEKSNLTLRQQEKIFSHARIVLNLFNSNNYIFPTLYVLLIYIRCSDFEFYKKILGRKLTPQFLLKELSKKISSRVDEDNKRLFMHTEALLLYLYFNFYRETNQSIKLIGKKDGVEVLLITSEIDDSDASTIFNFIQGFEMSRFSNTKLDYLLNGIDLTNNLVGP